MIKVLIFSDHSIFRNALLSRMGKCDEIEVLDEVEINHTLVERTEEVHPDFILMSINVTTLNGIDATAFFKEKFPHARLVIISMHDDKEYTFSVLQPGASYYLLKDELAEQLNTALKAVYNSGVHYRQLIADRILRRDLLEDKIILTSREQAVLDLIANGLNNKQAARKLDISVRTIESHRRNIKGKLNITTTNGLIRYAIESELTSR